MTVRLKIISAMRQIAEEQKVTLPPLDDALSLHATGFDSLAFAILVARLEDDLVLVSAVHGRPDDPAAGAGIHGRTDGRGSALRRVEPRALHGSAGRGRRDHRSRQLIIVPPINRGVWP